MILLQLETLDEYLREILSAYSNIICFLGVSITRLHLSSEIFHVKIPYAI